MIYIVCMRSTNLVLDEHLIDGARAAAGLKTYSETLNLALAEFIRKNVSRR